MSDFLALRAVIAQRLEAFEAAKIASQDAIDACAAAYTEDRWSAMHSASEAREAARAAYGAACNALEAAQFRNAGEPALAAAAIARAA